MNKEKQLYIETHANPLEQKRIKQHYLDLLKRYNDKEDRHIINYQYIKEIRSMRRDWRLLTLEPGEMINHG